MNEYHENFFDLIFDNPKEAERLSNEVIEKAKKDGRQILTEFDELERKKREREHALKILQALLTTDYLYPSYKRIKNKKSLSDLLEEIKMYLKSISD